MALKLLSWNVNGLRAVAAKPDWRWFTESTADIVALQETKALKSQLPESVASPAGWHAEFCSSSVKKGYSGVAVFSRMAPLGVRYELPWPEQQGEGRLLHLEFAQFHLMNGYFPNGGAEICDAQGRPSGQFTRLPYKMAFFEAFLRYAEEARASKPVVICGDFNIAHRPEDLARPRENEKSTGFLPEERAFLDRMLAKGYLDTFRLKHPEAKDAYSWWSYKTRARARNIGWRIDYFFVSSELADQVEDAWIEDQVMGSDHCPVGLSLSVSA
ncbi:MAG: exodeoxyribonuclease III [Desulfovibrio sp.]|nr:exodeoxyribonuclease III [Desulfovibrio sp.]